MFRSDENFFVDVKARFKPLALCFAALLFGIPKLVRHGAVPGTRGATGDAGALRRGMGVQGVSKTLV